MSIRGYVYFWLLLAALLSYENWALNHQQNISLVFQLQKHIHGIENLNLSTAPGRPMSLALGWTGLSLLLLTNLYIMRKRWPVLRHLGNLGGWLNFHIFCGLCGPTLIIFHSDFKVRGLVGISFWSMIIVATSGVVGRYIYIQIIRQEKLSQDVAEQWSRKLESMRSKLKTPVAAELLTQAKNRALRFVGGPGDESGEVSLARVLLGSIWGDLRLLFLDPQAVSGMPLESRYLLAHYARARRQALFLDPFRKLLAHWHTFHVPFAFFMYLAAIIHVAAALVFGIS